MSLEQAIEENTKAIRELVVLLAMQNKAAIHAEAVSTATQSKASGMPGASPCLSSPPPPKEEKAESAGNGVEITYAELSRAFLGAIKHLGTAAAAKEAILTPLGLDDLKSNATKTDLFPAIMERIEKAVATK